MFWCVVFGCVSLLCDVFSFGIMTYTFLSEGYPVSHNHLCQPSPALHPSSKHVPTQNTHSNTHTHTLDPYLSPSTLHLLLLAAPRWKVNKSCGRGGTLKALICLLELLAERSLVFASVRWLHSATRWPCTDRLPCGTPKEWISSIEHHGFKLKPWTWCIKTYTVATSGLQDK